MAKETINVLEVVGINDEGEEIIEQKTRSLKCSALLPRLYRFKFGRDMISDMLALDKAYRKAAKGVPEDATEDEIKAAQLSVLDLTIFENTAWLMMKHAGEDVGESPDEWLDKVCGPFTIYEVMPKVLAMWNASQVTTAKPAKK